MAWGLGLLSGFAVVLSSRRERGVPLQCIAVASSVLGVALGKYLIFFQIIKKVILEKHGQAAIEGLSMLSPKVFLLFTQSLVLILSPHDALWLILAMITAWRLPASNGFKAPPGQFQPSLSA